jgi:16S rRNA (cytosine967-C5)-methyltransferase
LSYHYSHITSAIKIIETAKLGEPLVHHLKKFFAADKKFGSKDRKSISSLCYNFYRIGNVLENSTIEDRIAVASFLCSEKRNAFLETIAPQYNKKVEDSLEEKCNFLNINVNNIFPFLEKIGEYIVKEKFAYSFLKQPLFYIRVRPNQHEVVNDKLTKANIVFNLISPNCIALPAATKIENVLHINKEVVVQDYNSQAVFNSIEQYVDSEKKAIELWDCCTASGGKSILLHDIFNGKLNLNVSDVRANMLNNLRSRFKEAGIKNYHAFVADLINPTTTLPRKKYDVIVCDAPCTGSGTWARTPEQLAFFEEKNIQIFSLMQQKIASTVIPFLKKDGIFVYITCSVFKKENEDVVNYLKEKFHLRVRQMEYYKGYEMQADTMFAAILSF